MRAMAEVKRIERPIDLRIEREEDLEGEPASREIIGVQQRKRASSVIRVHRRTAEKKDQSKCQRSGEIRRG